MKISIAMATYNGAKYLREQLDSFVAQTRQPDELVVCDDGSSDETVEILQSFAELAPFDVHIQRNQKNLGYAKNFSKALSICMGDLVFLSDQDDVWFPDKIKTITEIAESDVINQVFMNDAELTNKDLCQTGLTKLGQIRMAGISDKIFIMGCCAAIKREFMDDCLPVPDVYGAHDAWLVNMAEGLGKKRIIEKTLQYYRRHEDNESDFIANRINKINRVTYNWHQLLPRIKKNSPNKLEQLVCEIDCAIQKLGQLHDGNSMGYVTINEINEYKRELVCKQKATKERMEILKKYRIMRLAPVAKMLIVGQYKYFQGIKSAIGDVLFN